MIYKRKEIVAAIQWNGSNVSEALDFANDYGGLWGDDFKINGENVIFYDICGNEEKAPPRQWLVFKEYFGYVKQFSPTEFGRLYKKASLWDRIMRRIKIRREFRYWGK